MIFKTLDCFKFIKIENLTFLEMEGNIIDVIDKLVGYGYTTASKIDEKYNTLSVVDSNFNTLSVINDKFSTSTKINNGR